MAKQMKLSDADLRERMQGCEYLAGQNISSVNAENRTVDIIFFTGIDIPRTDWWTGEKYVLRFDPKGGDFSLLNNGAPVLDNHSMWDGSISQKGRVEKAWQDGKDSKATLRFSKRASVNELWQDIEDKIVTKFSMGVNILREEKITENNLQIRLAKNWQPFELSIAPIPADFNTTTLAAQGGESPRAPAQKGTNMPDKVNEATAAQPVAAPVVDQEALKRAAAADEKLRISEITKYGHHFKLEALAAQYVDGNKTVEEFRKAALEELARRNEPPKLPDTQGPHTELVKDETDTRRALMSNAVLGLMDPAQRKADSGNQFLGLTILRIAEESVRLQHHLARIPARDEVVRLSMMSTSDFAIVLENNARKQLLAKYQLAAPTYRTWTKASTAVDFKTMRRIRLGETPAFLEVPEGAEIKLGSMEESRESYAIATYGRGVSFTRQMLINDDLGAFNDLISQFGAQAARLENKTVYAILYANAAMSDGIALFYATHYNVGTGVIGNTALDAMFTAMASQKGLDGASILNLVPRFLIVPKAKETTARMALTPITGNVKASDQNYFSGRLDIVADAELDTNGSGTTKWYGAADPAIAPGIEYAHLQGGEGPQFIRKDNEGAILGMQFYAFLDFGAKAIDWRPLYYSTGA